MGHLSTKHPYRGTRVSYDRSKGDIQEMLLEAGAIGLNWKENIFSLKKEVMPELQFMMSVVRKGEEIKFAVLMKPPMLMNKKRVYNRETYRNEVVDIPDPDASMRLLYWYIKSRLEGVRFNMEDVFDAFFSRVVTALPDGSASTLSETVMEHPEVIRKVLPTFTINTEHKALPDNSEEDQ
jgi:hypothetical protein